MEKWRPNLFLSWIFFLKNRQNGNFHFGKDIFSLFLTLNSFDKIEMNDFIDFEKDQFFKNTSFSKL
jgi:hypothetical protein